MDTQEPRPYRSPLRRQRADQTRSGIRQAAHNLFLAEGYRATTLSAVAEQADVAVDTIYKTFGTKRALLVSVMDAVIGGDDSPTAVLDRPGPQALRAEPDQHRQIAMLAEGITQQLERIGPMDHVLHQAAAVDTDAAALRHDIQDRQRRQAMATIVDWIAEQGPLIDGLSREDAASAVWTLTSPEVHRLLCEDSGWSAATYQHWLTGMLTATLLPGG